ncbi:MAG: hypothetical protein M5U19_16410 [Microthrixaceae bacterium]|nr:hypothetical protein [Microthrixaceae bacterium]
MALRRPFIVFALAYVLLFAVGFSFIANFGILTRQRVQGLPVLPDRAGAATGPGTYLR